MSTEHGQFTIVISTEHRFGLPDYLRNLADFLEQRPQREALFGDDWGTHPLWNETYPIGPATTAYIDSEDAVTRLNAEVLDMAAKNR